MDPSLVSDTPRREFLNGVRDQLPLLLGVVPFGLIFGAVALESGVSPAGAQGLSLFVFGGSAQFASLNLIASNVPVAVVVLTIFVVNLRHALYSASLSRDVQHLPTRWKLLLAYLLTDEAFAVAQRRYLQADRTLAHWYTFGTGMTLWISWQASTLLGVALGARIPEGWSLDFALPLTFLAMLVPALVDRPTWTAAVGGAALALALRPLPYNLGLVVAAMTAVGLAVVMEKRP